MLEQQPILPDELPILLAVWNAVDGGKLYAVANGKEYLVEGPMERQDSEFDFEPEPEEAVLRIFTSYEDAVMYCEDQTENYGSGKEMQVVETTLSKLFGHVASIENNSEIDFDALTRFDVCRLKDGEPIRVDCLLSPFATIH